MKYDPHAYQKRSIKFTVERRAAGLFLDPGLGKTSITYAALKLLMKSGEVEKALIIAPLRPAASTWPQEAQKWHDFRELNIHVLHGPDKEKLLDQPHDVSVINPDGVPWLLTTMRERNWWWDILVIDESTRYKNPRTTRFKTLKSYLGRFNRRVILTGTPAPNNLLDLWAQVYLLDGGAALGRTFTSFRQEFFKPTGYGGYTWTIKDGAEKQIYARLSALVLRMEAEDYLQLPPLINNTVYVDLPESARKVYNQMEKTMLAAVSDELVTAANAAAATNKCRQIANGGIYLDEGGGYEQIHDAKTEAVEELVEELSGKPALVAYEYKHDLERLQRAFPRAPHLGGGVSSKEQVCIEAAWNAGDLPVLLAQPSSVAHGLNLQGTSAAVILHSLTWNLEDYLQFIRRVWRQGQKERVFVHHIVARGTVDEIVMKTLARKDREQRSLLDALKDYARVAAKRR